MTVKVLTAEYVLPISSEPISNGAVAIDADKIVDVGTRDEIAAKFPDADLENFGTAAMLPGFVNCHSHLELTALRGALDDVEQDFKSWLLKATALRGELSDEAIIQSAIG